MYDFKITETRSIEFKVDPNVYSDAVISKVLYWLAADFIIERKSISPTCQHILLICKKEDMSEDALLKYREEIAQQFMDYKVREIVRTETEGIRNILYLKAFANCSELEDLRGG